MSGFLLDTSVPSELVRPQPEPKFITWIGAQNLDMLFISAVSFGELRKGIVLLSPGKRREAGVCIWLLQVRSRHSRSPGTSVNGGRGPK